MNKLPENFSLKKYGLEVRLVNEHDADFILSLRSNSKKTKYMITLDNSIKSQKKWIQEYKLREKEGLDYYFIYSNTEGKSIGLNRISHVDYNKRTAVSASWVAIEGLIYEPFLMQLIHYEIAFNSLGIDTIKGEIHKKNNRLIRFYKLFHAEFNDNGTDFYPIITLKDEFIKVYDYRLTKMILKDL